MLLESFFRHYGHTLVTAAIFTEQELKSIFDISRPLHKTPLAKIITLHIERLFAEKNDKEAITQKSLIKRFFKSLHQRGHITHNPTQYFRVYKSYPDRKTTFFHSEIENILCYLKWTITNPSINSLYNLEMYRYFLYVAATGQRREELLNLRVKDICLEGKKLIIEKSKKMKDRRILSFNDFLSAYQERVIADMVAHCITEGPNEPLFSFVNHDKPSQLWIKIRKKMELRIDLNMHDLRRLYIRTGLKEGLSLSRIQYILGHTSTQSLLKYIELDYASLQKMLEEEEGDVVPIHKCQYCS